MSSELGVGIFGQAITPEQRKADVDRRRSREAAIREAKRETFRREQEALAFVQRLAAAELAAARDAFLAQQPEGFVRKSFDRMFKLGKWPASFVDSVFERRTGKAVH